MLEFDGDNLTRLNSCGQSVDAGILAWLEKCWQEAANSGVGTRAAIPILTCPDCWPVLLRFNHDHLCPAHRRLRRLDPLIGGSLPYIIDAIERGKDRDKWRNRLSEYGAGREQLRASTRARDLNARDLESLNRLKAAFDAWDYLASEEERESVVGLYYKSYQLEIRARLAATWREREASFRDAFRVCLSLPRRHYALLGRDGENLLRRGYTLASHYFRVCGFGLINSSKPDLGRVQECFEKALSMARKADEVRSMPHDVHLLYCEFWVWAIRLRRAEVECDMPQAAEAFLEADLVLDKFRDPGVLFRESHFWYSRDDLRNELNIIDCLEALGRGTTGLADATNALRRWVDSSRRELGGTVRFERMRLRLGALDAIENLSSGGDPAYQIAQLRNSLTVCRSAGEHTSQIINEVHRVAVNQVTIEQAIKRVRELFPLDARCAAAHPLDGGKAWSYLPHWYKEYFDRAINENDSSAAYLVAIWYCRVVVDYLWAVYVRNLLKEGKAAPLDRPDFLMADAPELSRAAMGLAAALCWTDGQPAVSLKRFNTLLTQLADRESADVITLLSSLVAITSKDLYPQPLLILGEANPSSVAAARKFNCPPSEIRISSLETAPRAGSYVYVKPRYKGAGGVLQNEKVTLYDATAFGQPVPVTVVCEGIYDEIVLRTALGKLDQSWEALAIAIVPGDGDKAPHVFLDRQKQAKRDRLILVADGDKAPANNPKRPWQDAWDRCCYGFIFEPDLERLDITTFCECLSQYWAIDVDREGVSRLSRDNPVGTLFEQAIGRTYKKSYKCETFVRILSDRLLRNGFPPVLTQLARTVLLLANGRQLPCRHPGRAVNHSCFTKD